MTALAQITIKSKEASPAVYHLDQDRITIGRDESNFIALKAKPISRCHAEILHENGLFFLRDLKSHNGTSLNEKKLAPQEKVLLKAGDIIQIADYKLHFQKPSASEEDLYEITDTDVLEVKMVKKLLKAMDRESAPSLEIMDGSLAGTRFVLEAKNQEVLIGRDPSCEFVIDSDVISRKHARVSKHYDSVTIHDLGSKNGIFVNRERVQEKTLQDGDIIHLGTLGFSFRNPQELAFDLEAPKISKPSAPSKKIEPEETPEPDPESVSSASFSRSSSQKTSSEEASITPETFSLSKLEIGAIALGLIVLAGSLWALIKLL